MNTSYPKTGYIHSDFRLFYLNETAEQDFSYHYHDFHKLLVFIGGNISYLVEGRTYSLRPGDIVLVRAGEIHHPTIHDQTPYERLILYLEPDFLAPGRNDGCDLSVLFTQTGSNLLQISDDCRAQFDFYISQLQDALDPDAYGASVFQKSAVLSFLLWLIRIQKDGSLRYREASVSNPLILQILTELNDHIDSQVSIDDLAARFHVSRSWLMHLFKAETGWSILSYLTEKRLFLARKYIQSGMSVTEACSSCGFANYTSFYKAFRERFGYSPKDARRF